MLEQICAFIHNYFVYSETSGTFTVSGGALVISDLVPGQYFRITGSRFNDGVYQYPAELVDETFDGTISEMRPPRSFLSLAEEIEAWQEKYGGASAGPYQSESFGGYSYTLKSGASGSDTAPGWQGAFRSRLNQWRKLA